MRIISRPSGRALRFASVYRRQISCRYLDDLPFSPSVSQLRAVGLVTAAMTSVVVGFGEGGGGLRCEVEVTHRALKNGGSWSFCSCSACRRRARVLRLFDGRPLCCRRLLGLGIAYRSWSGEPAERDAARMERIASSLSDLTHRGGIG